MYALFFVILLLPFTASAKDYNQDYYRQQQSIDELQRDNKRLENKFKEQQHELDRYMKQQNRSKFLDEQRAAVRSDLDYIDRMMEAQNPSPMPSAKSEKPDIPQRLLDAMAFNDLLSKNSRLVFDDEAYYREVEQLKVRDHAMDSACRSQPAKTPKSSGDKLVANSLGGMASLKPKPVTPSNSAPKKTGK